MRRLKSIQQLLFMLLLNGCNSGQLERLLPSADPRINQVPMTAAAKSQVRDYFRMANAKAFAFSPEKGRHGLVWAFPSVEAARELAVQQCERRTRSRCVLLAVNDQIVWQPVVEAPQAADPVDARAAGPEVPSPVGRFAVHVASVRDLAEVPGEWRRLVGRYQALAGLEPQAPREVDLPGKGIFYRVIGGAFATRAEVQAVCKKLRSAGGYCAMIVL